MDCRRRAQCNLTIMQQIGELKNWHQQQKLIQQPKAEPKSNRQNQSLLPADPNNIQDLSDMDKKQCQARFENQILETQKTMQCDTDTVAPKIETKEKYNVIFDELPIHTTNTDFNKLIENSMKTSKLDNTLSVQTTKHKFLKKGEGTARFGMVLPKPGKKCSVNNVNIVSVTEPQNFDKNLVKKYTTNKDFLENRKNSVASPKSPEQTKAKGTSWKSVFKSSPQSKSSDEIQLNVNTDSAMLSFIEKILSLDEANKKECEELKIFELLEQRVLDSSFSSNSSILTRLMENSVKSTPVKYKLSSDTISDDTECGSNSSKRDKSSIITNVCTSSVDSSFDFINNSKIKKQDVEPCNILPSDSNENEEKQVSEVYNNKLLFNSNGDVEKSLHVHFAENDSYKSFENDKYCGSGECTEMQKYDSQLRRQNSVSFDDYEEWSCGDCTCENNTEYSSSEEDCRAVSPPSPVSHSSHKANSVNRKTSCENMLNVEGCKDSDYRIYYTTNNNATSEKANNTGCDMHTTELKTVDASIKTDDVVRRSVIEARLKALETEIETFCSENNKLKKLRSEYDQEYKKLQNEKKQFLKHLNEEKNKIAADLEEEKRKLAKEKLVFEKYSKTVCKNPSKRERAEILALKQKLTELQEEMNKKESRWGASQARVRNQMRQLEEDNKRLKDEIEQIKRMSTCNHHISGNYQIQKNPVSNTQLIHIINKQLSNLGYLPNFEEESLDLSKQINKFAGRKIVGQNPKTKELKKVSEAITKLNVCDGSKDNDTGTYSKEENNPIKITVCTETIKQVNESENSVLNADQHVLTDKTCKSATELYGFLENVCRENKEITINSETVKEIIVPDGKEIIKEMIFPDGRKEIYYPNGNTKKISPNGDVTKIIYFNGDVKETSEVGTVKYYYAESKVWHTTYPDGLEVLDYPNGLVEQRCKNGTVNVTYPNGSKKHTYPDNSEEWIYPDGSTMKINLNNDKILTLPNGQKEIHTKEHMRREYPDGTIKFVYPDGTQETRYSNGRIRLKDKSGNLVMDSG